MEAGLINQSFSGGSPTAVHTAKNGDAPQSADHPPMQIALVMSRLDEEQANDIVCIDLMGKSDVADAMIIASGRSKRHVAAMADKIAREIKDEGFKMPALEGLPSADWVLIDAGDVIVHIFRPEVRSFYNLERIWAPELFAEGAEDGAFAPPTDAFDMPEPSDET